MKKAWLSLVLFFCLVFPVFASQHDYVIENNPGATFRADLNSALQAIVTLNAGATAPATTFPNMWWFDTSTSKLKRRNNANDAWISSDSGIQIASAAGTGNAITADFDPDISLADKTLVAVIASAANTSATPTFAPDGLTARTITKDGGSALLAGDIPAAGFVMLLEYNLSNTRWELLNPSLSTKVTAPSSTTENKIPQWDSASKTLKDGLNVGTGANNIPQLDGSGKILSSVLPTSFGTHAQLFTSNGTWNWTTAGSPSFVIVTAMAGGGGGGGQSSSYGGVGGGGGSGACVISNIVLVSGDITVTVGGGGAGGDGASNAPGGAGGASSFGTHVVVNGGTGGTGGESPSQGTGGSVPTVKGFSTAGNNGSSGAGGSTYYGTGGAKGTTGSAGTGYGAGGGGGGDGYVTGSGGAGSGGFVYVVW